MGPIASLLALVLTFVPLALCKPAAPFTDFVAGKSNQVGFSFELALRDPNLTAMEVVRQSSSVARPYDIGIRPQLHTITGNYVFRAGIGANPTKVFELLFDTGSDFIWTQCAQCTQCFEQSHQTYNPVHSTTCFNLTYHHPLCTPPCTVGANGACLFYEVYGNDKFVMGYMVRDRFVLPGRTLNPPVISSDLVFGCSLRSTQLMFNSPNIDGIIGMDRGAHSLIRQLNNYYNVHTFSHCLVELYTDAHSYVRFGSEVTIPSGAKSIPILALSAGYHVPLADFSVVGRRLNLPAGTVGNCIMDTGTTITRMVTPAYEAIKKRLMAYFALYWLKPISGQLYPLDLCYERRAGFDNWDLPAISLHFVHSGGEVEMQLDPAMHLFVQDHSAICLAMLPHPKITIIGGMMMQNFNIAYDLVDKKIYYAPEKCDGR